MVVDADLKSAHALNGFYMLFSRRHGPGPAEALVRREWPPNKDRPPGGSRTVPLIAAADGRWRELANASAASS
jgi:hypothetical protein